MSCFSSAKLKIVKNMYEDKVKAVKDNNPNISDYQLSKTILLSLGDSEEFIDSLPREKVLEALNYVSVVETETFLKSTKDGAVEVSEELFYTTIEVTKEIPITTNNFYALENQSSVQYVNLPNYTQTFGDCILRSTANKRNSNPSLPGRDLFTIRGEFEWKNRPLCQFTDILAIASSGNIDNNYKHYAGAWYKSLYLSDRIYKYDDFDTDNNIIEVYNPSIYGLAVKTPLSLDISGDIRLEYVYAYYGISTQNDVSCQVAYSHATVGLGGISVSVSSAGSISFGASIGQTKEDYMGRAFTLSHGVNYK